MNRREANALDRYLTEPTENHIRKPMKMIQWILLIILEMKLLMKTVCLR